MNKNIWLIIFNSKGFKILLGLGFITSFTRYLEVLANAYFVFQLSQDPLLVGINAGLRLLPLFLFGWVIGIISDRLDKRLMVILSLMIFFLVSFSLFFLIYFEMIEIWHLMIGSLFSGIGWAFELPTRRSLIVDFLNSENVSLGVGIDASTQNFTRILGPLMAGILLVLLPSLPYLMTSISHLLGIFLSLLILKKQYSKFIRKLEKSSVFDDITYLLKGKAFRLVLGISVIMNIWAFPYQSMVPVVAETVLKINPFLLGLLVAIEGTGAFLGSIFVATFVRRNLQSMVFTLGSSLFLICIFIFAISDIYLLSVVIVFLGGLGISCFSTLQSVIILDRTPSHLRGSAMGSLTTMIGTQPIGALHIGWVCSIFTPSLGLRISSSEGLILLILFVFINSGVLFNKNK
ncbi:MAG: MFS transporter [SAR202 cluster bacterium]|nr:MFS transporter [SAR202 cluster bacterium]